MAGGFPRRTGGRTPRNMVMVIAEGRTEEVYFRGLKRRGCNVEIRIPASSPTDALNLVRSCVGHISKDDVRPEYGDLVICAFDVEGNSLANLSKALRMAEENGISVALSNPCFELWLLLHFRDVSHRISCQEADTMLRDYIPEYRKASDYREMLAPNRSKAMTRARRLQNGIDAMTPKQLRGRNPWTNMDKVIGSIEELMARNERMRP